MTNTLRKNAFEWSIDDSGIATADHLIASVRIADPGAPHIGKGRWSIPIHLLQDKEVSELLDSTGLELTGNMEAAREPRTNENNPQTLFRKWKEDVLKKIRDIARTKIPKIEKRLTRIKEQVKEIREDASIPREDKQCLTAELAAESAHLAHLRYEKTRDNLNARRWVYQETITKPWMNENKDKKPRDPIKMLKVPGSNPPQYKRGVKEMLEIARDHHVNLQEQDLPIDLEAHQTQVDDILQGLPEQITDDMKAKLASEITQDEIMDAIYALPNGKSPGLDGVPHEFWKTLLDRYKSSAASAKAKFDVTKTLRILTNDIEQNGLIPESNFAEGWMCPIFKKGDRTNIANYRPITVLNADYKILTRVLAMRLADAVPNIIHKDQAGFMRGRHIEDHTDLANYMIHRCEMEKENGAIIFLDQEKAYDKILHPFLWASLETFGFPKRFTDTVKTLYSNAYTTIIMNGEKAEPFKVTRGVRQGDPMSCLLFNIAIESLANLLRKSDLKGFQTRGDTERLLVTLFADDTTVYLSEGDSFQDLKEILDKWCSASGAKFNVGKTEILPIGTKEHRRQVCQTRKLNLDDPAIDQNIRIARDGEHIRTLGAYVGNGITEITVWTPVLERIDEELDRWDTSSLTQEGRRLIITMQVGGRTQYLTRVQGMPVEAQTRIEKRIKNFMWGDKQAMIKLPTLQAPKEVGGLKLLDIDARNKAIDLRRLQAFHKPSTDRPRWAWVADEIIARNASTKINLTDNESVVNTALQDIPAVLRSKKAKLPATLKRMLTTGREFNIVFDPPSLSESVKRALPFPYHIGRKLLDVDSNELSDDDDASEIPRTRTRKTNVNNLKEAACLRTHHKLLTTGDVLDFISTLPNHNHAARKNCKCEACKRHRNNGCENPHKCMKKGKQLIDELPEKFRPDMHDESMQPPDNYLSREIDEPALLHFDKNVTVTSLANTTRVFGGRPITNAQPMLIKSNSEDEADEVTVYTDGSCINNGDSDARAGAGYWYGENDIRNGCLRLPDTIEQSNNAGELVAILKAVQMTPTNTTLIIKTDSQYAIDGIITHRARLENRGWIEVSNCELFQAIISRLRQRVGETYLSKVKGHSGDTGNDGADSLAGQGAEKPDNSDEIDISVPEEYKVEGANLQTLSQALFYRGIREKKMESYSQRQGTNIMTDMVRWAIKDRAEKLPTDRAIWKSLRNQDIDKKIRAFAYRSLHDSHKLGPYWDHIPNCQYRADCPKCETIETLEHVLTDCQASGQQIIWPLVQSLFEKRGIDRGNVTIGNILGGTMSYIKNKHGRPDKGANRLAIIVMTESLHLIWKIRCEWKMDRDADIEKLHTKEELTRRWTHTIRRRMKLDQALAKVTIRGNKVNKLLMQSTWQGVDLEEQTPAEYQMGVRRVLVSTGQTGRRPPGRNR